MIDFLRKTAVRGWQAFVVVLIALGAFSLFTTPILSDILVAQQFSAASANSDYATFATINTTTLQTGTASRKPAIPGQSVTNSAGLTGTHNIYGWNISGPAGCYLQVYDTGPNINNVTPGTTAPVFSFATGGTTGQIYHIRSEVPFFSVSSTLQIFGSTAPSGGTACTSPIEAMFYVK